MRQPENQASRKCVLKIRARQRVAAFASGAAGFADQAAQRAVARAIGGQHNDFKAIDTVELGADDQGHSMLFRGNVGAYHTRQRAFIGQRQSSVI